jgi:SAM-dependent methyltransferase
MTAIPRVLKHVYRKVIPRTIRDLPLIDWVKGKLFPHDAIYDAEYYETIVEGPAVRSAGTISETIVSELRPGRVVDVGCGTGALLQALRARGCEVFGLEYSEAALAYCRNRGLEVTKFNVEKDTLGNEHAFDVAVSMEDAEHLPERIADRYVDLLTRLSSVIVFTAAPPGQSGADHVNEQPPSYWITKFQQRGFQHARELSQRWREHWKASGYVESWYYQNLMIFRKPMDS